MLFSKRAELFLPEQWPTYFTRAKGCRVWDMDGREYIDMAIMGAGTNILGYGHPEVDEAVLGNISAGNVSTFNCSEEVDLAERLVELHPWADIAGTPNPFADQARAPAPPASEFGHTRPRLAGARRPQLAPRLQTGRTASA